jgi:hypothetical protein
MDKKINVLSKTRTFLSDPKLLNCSVFNSWTKTNVGKTEELIVDYRKWRYEHAPIHSDDAVVEQVKHFKFLGVHITKELSWSTHTSGCRKYFSWASRSSKFYSCTIESILTS